MEAPSNGTGAKSAKPRIRVRKFKATDMSVRLNPDFKVLHTESGVTPDANAENYEINPKSINFEDLVKLLHPSFISDYFYKILIFLKSENKELAIPNLAPFKEEFLVKIVDNRDRLLYAGFNEVSACIGRQIIDTLNANESVYKWSYSFNDGRGKDNILIYKKIFVKRKQKTVTQNDVTPSSASLSSSIEDLTISDQSITTAFKTQILNTTMKFIKDNNRFCLEYPVMLNYQGDFVTALIKNYKTDSKTLYSMLYEEMKQCSELYDFKVVFRETYNSSTMRILLQKIPKPNYKVEARESKSATKIILIYKKIFVKRKQKTVTQNDVTPSSASLSSSIEDLTISDQSITAAFKTQILNTTMKFIKDNNRFCLEYPVMLNYQGDFVTALIKNYKTDSKSLYSMLYEEMKQCSELYDFKVVFRETYNSSTMRILLQKIPKPNYKVEARECKSATKIGQKNKEESNMKHLTKAEKELLSKRALLNCLSETFITKSLKAVLDFLMDDTKATLEFREIFAKESEFLISLLAISRRKDISQLFPEPCVVMLKRIWRRSSAEDWSLRVDVGKLNKRTKLRTLTFYKEPFHETQEPRGSARQSTPKVETLQITIDNDQISPRNKIKQENPATKQTTNRKEQATSVTKQPIATRGIKQPGATKNEQPVGVRNNHSSAINGRNPKPPCSQEGAKTERAEPYKYLGLRKERLLEGMSNKVQCDLAEKIMRRMGWEGGALGVRGEGLLEPIVPDLHLSAGAGLGHVKQYQRTPPEFRETLLQSVVTLLQGDHAESKIPFSQPLSKKELRFTISCISALNAYSPVSVSRKIEMVLATDSLQIMENKDLGIEFAVSPDKKEITLKKIKHQSKGGPNKKSIPEIEPSKKLMNSVQAELLPFRPTAKSAKSLAQRVMFMETIKEFLGTSDPDKDYSFDFIINTKHKAYIQDVLTSFNRRSKTKYTTPMESDLYREIIGLNVDCFMQVVFDTQKYTLTKKYYQKLFTNSNIEPLKSRDVKNTIIYTNNDFKTDTKNDIDIVDLAIDDETSKEQTIVTIHDNDSDTPEVYIDSDDVLDSTGCEEDLTLDCTDLDEPFNKYEEEFDKIDVKIEESDDLNNVTNEIALLDLLEAENCVHVPLEMSRTDESSLTEVLKDIDLENNNFLDKDECTFQEEMSPSKRYRTDSDVSNRIAKRPKVEFVQNVRIIPENYPNEQINEEILAKVQKMLAHKIKDADFLPLLQCRGIQNGALIYCCHSEKSLSWLKNVINVACELNIIETEYREEKVFKFRVKINIYSTCDTQLVLDSLKLYNQDLNVDKWTIEGKTDRHFTVNVNEQSYFYILRNNCSLFAGIDKALFSIIWD